MTPKCNLCPRHCDTPRSLHAIPGTGEGYCQMGRLPVVARAALHFWEEPCISGTRGSGTIFFSGCNLKCVFCQNDQISRHHVGKEITVARLRELFNELIANGAHNINLVNPTHFADSIAQALAQPLEVPVVYNSSGYETIETLRMLEGKVDIYLPDMKYVDNSLAKRYSHAPDYFETASAAIREMYRQTGPFQMDDDGILQRGLVIRHLILPNCVQNTLDVIDWVCRTFPGSETPADTILFSLMSQYVPCALASVYPEINRRIRQEEYDFAEQYLFESGIENGFLQELDSAVEAYIPDFSSENI